jgi:homoserine dehydrogenase
MFALVLVGFGHVARRFVELLHEQRTRLARDYDFSPRIVGIATRCHGRLLAADGVDALALAARVADAGTIGADRSRGPSRAPFIRAAAAACADAARRRRLIVVETTTLDIAKGEPAIGHVRAALASGCHVVTANKGPSAFAYQALARAAEHADRRFLFEGAVMDGIPIFNLVRETLPGLRVTGFRGVVNSTTNFMLTAMEEGQSYEAALAEMQARGIAEADPSLDVDGWDAAAKTAALANVLLDANVTPHSIAREGITPASAKRAIAARRAGRRLKLVVRSTRNGGARNGLRAVPYNRARVGHGFQTVPRIVVSRVGLEELPADDLLAGLEGQQNALILSTDLLGEFAIVQRGGDLTQTAYALLSDVLTIARDVTLAPATRRLPTPARQGRSR